LAGRKQDLEQIFITMACKTSIKAGTRLTPDEALGLMTRLMSCPDNQYCPHGRPVSRKLDLNQLDRMFKRS
ncbi:MAG: DNA mismatch repair protein MutL, partial [Desulfonatronovibrionaceae bacterium]